jgi:hypothetical protein
MSILGNALVVPHKSEGQAVRLGAMPTALRGHASSPPWVVWQARLLDLVQCRGLRGTPGWSAEDGRAVAANGGRSLKDPHAHAKPWAWHPAPLTR